MQRSPLYDLHRRLGATFVERSGWEVPEQYQGFEQEYRAARQAVALMDRSPMGRLRMAGPDALDLLNRLSTNEVEALEVGQGTTTVLTTAKGRIIDWIVALHPEPEALTLITAPETPQAVAEWIDHYTIVEEISQEELTAATALLCLMGPQADAVLQEALGLSVEGLPPFGCLQVPWGDQQLLVARTDPVALPGFDLLLPAEKAEGLWKLLEETGGPELLPMGQAAFEALRVEAGIPRWGTEFDERYNPLEAGLLEAISWEKGCYIGQEVVARLRTYQKVQKYLVGLSFEEGPPPAPGAALSVEGVAAGSLTSVAYSPGAGKHLGLGYLRTQFVKQGAEVQVATEEGGAVRATVVRAPEVPQSLVPAALLAMAGGEDEEE